MPTPGLAVHPGEEARLLPRARERWHAGNRGPGRWQGVVEQGLRFYNAAADEAPAQPRPRGQPLRRAHLRQLLLRPRPAHGERLRLPVRLRQGLRERPLQPGGVQEAGPGPLRGGGAGGADPEDPGAVHGGVRGQRLLPVLHLFAGGQLLLPAGQVCVAQRGQRGRGGRLRDLLPALWLPHRVRPLPVRQGHHHQRGRQRGPELCDHLQCGRVLRWGTLPERDVFGVRVGE
mmetsp:Transcript_13827/g.33391  ORF Transcript_13827/g.33391 Transcript_13827/m.33391 type:complete len:231 (+) Transcript_13827:1615-2307(+)